jgi:hypothetical protein
MQILVIKNQAILNHLAIGLKDLEDNCYQKELGGNSQNYFSATLLITSSYIFWLSKVSAS